VARPNQKLFFKILFSQCVELLVFGTLAIK
jgi:hypothetical protein